MHSLLRHPVLVGRARTKVNVSHCTKRTTTSVSVPKDSRERTVKTVRNILIASASFSSGSLAARENDDKPSRITGFLGNARNHPTGF